MTELDVTLSDYALAVMCLVFAVVLVQTPSEGRRVRGWLIALFSSLATAAAMGGTVHGFFNEPSMPVYRVLWPATLVAIGVATLSGWNLGATLILPARGIRVVGIVTGIGFVVYCGWVLGVSDEYMVAIANYLPSAVFLLLTFGLLARRLRSWRIALGVLGIILTFVAAGVQQAGISVHPVLLTHNTLYHLIQAIGLLLLFLAGRVAMTIRRDMP